MKKLLSLLILSLALTGCTVPSEVSEDFSFSPDDPKLVLVGSVEPVESSESSVPILELKPSASVPSIEIEPSTAGEQSFSIPPYNGEPSAPINNNVPYFTDTDFSEALVSYEFYSDLDDNGRCGVCVASVGEDIMPTEERGEIGQVKPTGWKQNKYPGIVNKENPEEPAYLYNRCHLIAFCLTGENANEKNLITGTRSFNVDGMLPYELKVSEYVHRTKNHVLYRVTPVFSGDNLLADGVLIEASSVEDRGTGLSFCVFVFNVQPGISINYADGSNEVCN